MDKLLKDKLIFIITLVFILIGFVFIGFVVKAEGIPNKPDLLGIAIQKIDKVKEESMDVYIGSGTNMEIIMDVLDTHADVFRLMITDSMDKTDEIYQLRVENSEMRKRIAVLEGIVIDKQDVSLPAWSDIPVINSEQSMEVQ